MTAVKLYVQMSNEVALTNVQDYMKYFTKDKGIKICSELYSDCVVTVFCC